MLYRATTGPPPPRHSSYSFSRAVAAFLRALLVHRCTSSVQYDGETDIMLKLKRIYAPPERSDGYRVLVDRLWPRGLSKSKAHIDLWMKDIGPSDALRKWFGHDPERWTAFRARYWRELRQKSQLTLQIKKLLKERSTVTLLFGARDEQHNQAVALRAFLQRPRGIKAKPPKTA